MDKKKKNIKINNKVNLQATKTGDIKTNDFDMENDKAPALSTIKAQIRNLNRLINIDYTLPNRTEFDRLKIGLNLSLYGYKVDFDNLRMEDVSNPKESPSYMKDNEQKWERLCDLYINPSLDNKDEDNDISLLYNEFADDEQDKLSFLDFELDTELQTVEYTSDNEEISTVINDIEDIITDKTIKKRISYDDYKNTIGLINMYICDGFFVIDITGKWMHDFGVLGSLNKDNIRIALQKVLDLHVVKFNIDKFLQCAQIFICDVCVDLVLDSDVQVQRYIDGLSSFFPISTNRFYIAKYGRHGLSLKPKSKSLGYSLIAYSKGQELYNSFKRSTRAERYTNNIGDSGEQLAKRTLRLEAKFYKLADIRKYLDIENNKRGIILLVDILNSSKPVILKMFELFGGTSKALLERLTWLQNLELNPENLTLSEIFIAERFVEILKENNFDIELARSHIRTEYVNATDEEVKTFNSLANIRQNLLNFLVYRKPKSVTIMIAILDLLQAYYCTGMGSVHHAG